MARRPKKSSRSTGGHPPTWIEPQLTRLVNEPPDGPEWLHEIKYDGYRMHARIDGSDIRLLTRTGLDWSNRYQATIVALRALKVENAYLDGELCAVRPDGVTSFSRLQAATDEGRTGDLVFFAFDLLFLNGQGTAGLPLLERKERLEGLFKSEMPGLRFSGHVIGSGPQFREHACKLNLEGAVSKRIDRPYAPGDRGLWVKSKCLYREEFVVVGWTDPHRQPAAHRFAASRLLYGGRQAAIRRPGRNGDHRCGAQTSGRPSGPAEDGAHAAQRSAAARKPLRITARIVARALGES
ncbi:ATP-dependent DNA ligase [Bradyrhizobium sp. USDA 4473]